MENKNKKVFKRIYIEITNQCNLKCSFCPSTKREANYLSPSAYEEILSALKGHGNYIYLHVKGEPLYHPKIKEILAISYHHNLAIMLTTNGTLLKENLSTILSSLSIRQISLSLQSFEQWTDKKAALDYIEEVLLCVKMILEKTNIIIELRLWNYDEITKGKDGANSLFLRKIRDILDANIPVGEQKGKGSKLAEKLYLSKGTVFTWPSQEASFISQVGTCYGLRQQVAILVNGDVVPCCLDGEGEIILGNIFETSLQSMLQEPLAKSMVKGFEENHLVEALCQRCGYRQGI